MVNGKEKAVVAGLLSMNTMMIIPSHALEIELATRERSMEDILRRKAQHSLS